MYSEIVKDRDLGVISETRKYANDNLVRNNCQTFKIRVWNYKRDPKFEKPCDIVMYNFWDEPYVCPSRTVYVINSDLKPFVKELLEKRDILWASLMPEEEDGKK